MSTTNTVGGLPRDIVDAALSNTADEVKKLVPSTVNASWYDYGGSVVRTFLAFEAGRGMGWALDVSASESTMIGAIAVGLGVLGWSWLSKRWAAWRTNQAAKASGAASAQATVTAGTPTVVALEPLPNKV